MKEMKQIDYEKKLVDKQKHVKAVQDFMFWIVDEVRRRAKDHDSDKIAALKGHKTVDGIKHHDLRHHFLASTNTVNDIDIIDVIEFLADNISSALYESDDGKTLADPSSSSKIQRAMLKSLLMNTARHYSPKTSFRMTNDPHVWE